MRVHAVIPIRLGSTRFPGKALVPVLDRPLMQWVYEATLRASRIDRVTVATDDDRIDRAARALGAEVVRTSAHPRNGTERVAEVMRSLGDADVWLNVQGDEPLLTGDDLDSVIDALATSDAHGSTLAVPLDAALASDVNAVKVVCSLAGDALYFSRSLVPFPRAQDGAAPLLHVGVYAYRQDALSRYAARPPTPLERSESLEQLRVIEHGERMRVVVRTGLRVGVNVPGDVAAVAKVLRERRREQQ